jgi:hypothetical protein
MTVRPASRSVPARVAHTPRPPRFLPLPLPSQLWRGEDDNTMRLRKAYVDGTNSAANGGGASNGHHVAIL